MPSMPRSSSCKVCHKLCFIRSSQTPFCHGFLRITALGQRTTCAVVSQAQSRRPRQRHCARVVKMGCLASGDVSRTWTWVGKCCGPTLRGVSPGYHNALLAAGVQPNRARGTPPSRNDSRTIANGGRRDSWCQLRQLWGARVEGRRRQVDATFARSGVISRRW